MPPSDAATDAFLTVSELTRRIKTRLGREFGEVWVRGEVSRITYHRSGHVYLTLKDEDAVLDCAIWRSTASRFTFRIEQGQDVLVFGGVDVYAPRGAYQLIIRRVEPVGEGALRLAFEQMRKRLEAEGLFDPGDKKALPAFPRRVALVTSPTGAAVRDLVTVIQRRWPGIELVLVPVRVQGEGAAGLIARALAFADRRARADVIVVGRGGGSLEDLWCFNEEVVARAIHACSTPVVSAVGHETDVTIADLVADVRAATPSQAGEIVVPARDEVASRVDAMGSALARRLRSRLDHAWQRVEALADRPVLRDPTGPVRSRRDALRHLRARLEARSPVAELRRRAERLAALAPRLGPPLGRRVREGRRRVDELDRRLGTAASGAWRRGDERLRALEQRLRALSPLAVLGRGYSLTSTPDGRVVRSAADCAVGDLLDTRLADGGRLASRVERVEPATEDAS